MPDTSWVYDESIKEKYTRLLETLYDANRRLEDEFSDAAVAEDIFSAIDQVSNLMYSDPRC